MNTIQKFEFNGQLIDFEIQSGNVMVNATQMAKSFGKDVFQFTRIDDTKRFIEACLKPQNCGLLNIKTEEDLIVSKQKSGTSMHRVLALKFAAWLNPDFEIWVYATIDRILFDYYKRIEESLRISAKNQNRMEELENKLTALPEYLELKRLEFDERQLKNQRAKENRNQLEMFKETTE